MFKKKHVTIVFDFLSHKIADARRDASVRSYEPFLPQNRGLEKVLSTCSLNLPHFMALFIGYT